MATETSTQTDYYHSPFIAPTLLHWLCAHTLDSTHTFTHTYTDTPTHTTYTHTPVEAAEGRTAHNNVWNGAIGMALNTWKLCGWCIWYHFTNSALAITMSPSSPIKVPPTSCAIHTWHAHTCTLTSYTLTHTLSHSAHTLLLLSYLSCCLVTLPLPICT